jgi:hypothetical protein
MRGGEARLDLILEGKLLSLLILLLLEAKDEGAPGHPAHKKFYWRKKTAKA